MTGGYKGIMQIWAAGCGHPALPEKQRIAQLEWASTSAERIAERDAEAIRKQGLNLHIPIRGAERFRHDPFPARGKDSKTLVLAAFFPPFLSPQKEREPSET